MARFIKYPFLVDASAAFSMSVSLDSSIYLKGTSHINAPATVSSGTPTALVLETNSGNNLVIKSKVLGTMAFEASTNYYDKTSVDNLIADISVGGGGGSDRFSTYTSTVTNGTTTALFKISNYQQYFTGGSAHMISLPDTNILDLGWAIKITNKSTQSLIINTFNDSTIIGLPSMNSVVITCTSSIDNNITSWDTALTVITLPSSGEKIVSATNTGLAIHYAVITQLVDGAFLTGQDWSTGTATYTGVQGQYGYDDNFRYECTNTDTWKRIPLIKVLANLYLNNTNLDDTIPKSGGDLQSAYPDSIIGQRVRGLNFYYEKVSNTNWIKYATINI